MARSDKEKLISRVKDALDAFYKAKKSEKKEATKEEATCAVDAVLEGIKKAIKVDRKVQLIGFGTFNVRKRAARTGRNPQTGEAIKIKASNSIGFKAGSQLKGFVNR